MSIFGAACRPRRHLVDDEVVVIPHRSRDSGRVTNHSFRIRVWRAKEKVAVVLASQIPGQMAPGLFSTRLANLVRAAFLSHADCHFFVADFDPVRKGEVILRILFFDKFPQVGERQRLINPIEGLKHWCELEALVGQPVPMFSEEDRPDDNDQCEGI